MEYTENLVIIDRAYDFVSDAILRLLNVEVRGNKARDMIAGGLEAIKFTCEPFKRIPNLHSGWSLINRFLIPRELARGCWGACDSRFVSLA